MPLNITKIELIKGGLGSESLDFSVTINGADPIADESVYADPDADGSPGISPEQPSSWLSDTHRPVKVETAHASSPIAMTQQIQKPQFNFKEIKPKAASRSPAIIVTPGQLGQTATTEPVTISNCGDETLFGLHRIRSGNRW